MSLATGLPQVDSVVEAFEDDLGDWPAVDFPHDHRQQAWVKQLPRAYMRDGSGPVPPASKIPTELADF